LQEGRTIDSISSSGLITIKPDTVLTQKISLVGEVMVNWAAAEPRRASVRVESKANMLIVVEDLDDKLMRMV
jgi:hypothetical protein